MWCTGPYTDRELRRQGLEHIAMHWHTHGLHLLCTHLLVSSYSHTYPLTCMYPFLPRHLNRCPSTTQMTGRECDVCFNNTHALANTALLTLLAPPLPSSTRGVSSTPAAEKAHVRICTHIHTQHAHHLTRFSTPECSCKHISTKITGTLLTAN